MNSIEIPFSSIKNLRKLAKGQVSNYSNFSDEEIEYVSIETNTPILLETWHIYHVNFNGCLLKLKYPEKSMMTGEYVFQVVSPLHETIDSYKVQKTNIPPLIFKRKRK